MKILFIGDVYQKMGREALKKYLPMVKEKYKPNIIILNGENYSDGNGLTLKHYKELMSLGISLITLGNHTYTKKEIIDYIDDSNVIKPLNWTKAPGKGFKTINYNGKKITIISLIGRVFMRDYVDNPFTVIDEFLKTLDSDYIVIDFHAEATSEKYAMAGLLDGRVDALIGTHTHVPTCDNIRFPKGLLYQTDVGMTGARFGVIGGNMKQGIDKFVRSIPQPVIPEDDGPLQFNATIIDLDKKTIDRINIYE